MKILRGFFKLILVIIILGIVYLNYSIYYQAKFTEVNGYTYNQDVYNQLQFLKAELRAGAGMQMQSLFPEGFVFINALYGLSWANLIQNLDQNSEVYQEGIDEINWSMRELDSENATRTFDKDLPLEYGAFYKGWCNFLLAKKLTLQAETDRDSSEVTLFRENCEQIKRALEQSQTPYLESYKARAWPADIMLAVASIAVYDKIFSPEYKVSITDWLGKVKQHLDPETKLIPHSVHPITAETFEGARGSSQSLMLIFLIDIDQAFAQEQFDRYKLLFLDSRFGLPGIREYPKGIKGGGDIDSGPVIFGIGGSASIVGQRTMGKFENWDTYEGLRNSIEGFGAAYTSNSMKKYVFGELPMADAFIAWSNSLETTTGQVKPHSHWRISFQLLSLLCIVVFGLLIRGWRRKSKI